MIQIIMSAIFYPILLILYFVMKYYGKRRNQRLFSCDVKDEWVEDLEVKNIGRVYRKDLNLWLFCMTLMTVPPVFIPYFSIAISYWIMWMMVAIVVFNIPYGRAYKKLRLWKENNGYYRDIDESLVVDLTTPGVIQTIKWYTFLVPGILSFLSFIYSIYIGNKTKWGMAYSVMITGSFFLCVLMCIYFAFLSDRKKSVVICQDSEVNINYNRASKKIWKTFWVLLIGVTCGIAVGIAATLTFSWNIMLVVWTSLGMIPVVCGIAIHAISQKNRLEHRYQNLREDFGQGDERFFIWGQFYYNPKDSHSTIDTRVGTGITINMASKTGKAMLIVLMVTLLSMPVICAFIIRDEFTPIHLEVRGENLISSHTSEKYRVPIDEISDLKLLTSKLPKMYRTNGTGLDTLRKGDFSVGKYGSCNVLLNPQNKKFIHFRYQNRWYFLSGSTDKETQKMYNQLGK